MDEKNQGKKKGYDQFGLIRKAVIGAMIVGGVYAIERYKPIELIFPNEGKSVENYIADIKPEDVGKYPEQYGTLASTVLKNLPSKNALGVINGYAAIAPDSIKLDVINGYAARVSDPIKSDAILGIYSQASTNGKCDAIDAIINNSSKPIKFYLTEKGFGDLTAAEKGKMILYGPLDMLGSDVKRPK